MAPPVSYTVDVVPSGTLNQLPEWAGVLLDDARVGHLGMLDAADHPRVLPVTYAISQGAAWTVVDNKPKRPGRAPARVDWLRRCAQAAITVDHYADEWSELRWVQLLGEMAVLDGPPSGPGMAALSARYPQYRADPPPGPLLRLTVSRAVWWRAGSGET
jgi:PPOX class probable F420-dependent enzyme